MSKHLLVKPKMTKIFGVPALVFAGKATFSLAEPNALIGALVAGRGRRGIEVDHAASTITVRLLPPRKRKVWVLALVTMVPVALAPTLVHAPPPIRHTSTCIEPVQVGKPMPYVEAIQSSSLGGVRTVSYMARCSKSKLRATVDTVTRRVLSVVSG